MNLKQYTICAAEAQNYSSRDAYISDLALSAMWGNDPENAIQPERLEALGEIYDAAGRSVKEIAAAAGISGRKLAERFGIPYRTVEDWCAERRKCPDYVRLMMQEILNLYHPPID